MPYNRPRTVLRSMARATIVLSAITMLGCSKSQSAFPTVDQSKLKIILQRSACYGNCPDYKVTISGDGKVVFTTATRPTDPVSEVHRRFAPTQGVLIGGTHQTRINPKQVTELLEKVRSADFFSLKSEYRAGVTDNPTYIVTIDTGHGSKSVVDYVGLKAGMPKAVKDLEDAIDQAAGTKQWIEGSAGAIAPLLAEHADFKGGVGAVLMNAAAARDDVNTMERLKNLGAPTSASPDADPLTTAAGANALEAARFLVAEGAAKNPTSLKNAIGSAIRANSDQLLGFLVETEGKTSIGRDEVTRFLPSAASNGNLAMSKFLIEAGADVRGQADRRKYDDPPIFGAAKGDLLPAKGANRLAVVQLLLDNKADIHQCSLACNSILAFVSDPKVTAELIKAGADPNFKDEDGEPIIFSIYDEAVALEMISSGAKLYAVRPADKMTLRGWATYQKWPKVLTLLSKNGL